jgi:hypothetical protein
MLQIHRRRVKVFDKFLFQAFGECKAFYFAAAHDLMDAFLQFGGYLRRGAASVFRLILKPIPGGRVMAGGDDYSPCCLLGYNSVAMTGVGAALGFKYALMPFPASTSATAAAKSSEANLVS